MDQQQKPCVSVSIKAGGKTFLEEPDVIYLVTKPVLIILASLWSIFSLVSAMLVFLGFYLSESAVVGATIALSLVAFIGVALLLYLPFRYEAQQCSEVTGHL